MPHCSVKKMVVFSAKSALGIYFFAKNRAYPMIIISLALTYFTYLSAVAKLT